MMIRSVRAFFWVIGLGLLAPAKGQDAQAVLDAAAKVYEGASSYAVQSESRVVSFMFSQPAAPEGQPRYAVQGVEYSRLHLKVRRPDQYWVGYMRHGGRQGLTNPGMPPRWSFYAQTGPGQAQQGMYVGSRFSVRDSSPAQLAGVLRTAGDREEPVLTYFYPPETRRESTIPFGLIEPELIGKETRLGRMHYRIAAKTVEGEHPVTLWIEENTSLVARVIVQRGRSRMLSVSETIYNNQRLNPPFGGGDFMLNAPANTELPGDEQLGFGPVADLVRDGDIRPDANAPAPAEAAVASQTETPETPAPAPAEAPKKSEGQALSYEQMAGIVLVEGDDGAASGFMTKIRDIDFVVTNLHVLGDNKKITLKNLRGEEIPYAGIFGAVGSDVAIIRIGSGQGELKLAEDVFRSSKIGDKVVVVGNRQGGGVATQVEGRIMGIGPTRVEVDANFEPGNSGSPIVNLSTGEVVGVASYSETRRINVEEGAATSAFGSPREPARTVEKRWFGYRLDGIAKWESIDLAKWNAQAKRIDDFRELSEALVAVIRLEFGKARMHPKLSGHIERFEGRISQAGRNSVTAATEVKDLFRLIRSISEDGVRDLTNGDYYDYYRTCLYWENSIPSQLDYRKAIIEVLKKYEANSAGYLSRMRGGS